MAAVALFVMAAEISGEHFYSTLHTPSHHALVHLSTKLDKNHLTPGTPLMYY